MLSYFNCFFIEVVHIQLNTSQQAIMDTYVKHL